MKKYRTPVMPTLQKVMEDNRDLAFADEVLQSQDYIDPPTPASRGSESALLPEAVCALLVLYNARVQWNWNYWILRTQDGRQMNVATHTAFEDWRNMIIGP